MIYKLGICLFLFDGIEFHNYYQQLALNVQLWQKAALGTDQVWRP